MNVIKKNLRKTEHNTFYFLNDIKYNLLKL